MESHDEKLLPLPLQLQISRRVIVRRSLALAGVLGLPGLLAACGGAKPAPVASVPPSSTAGSVATVAPPTNAPAASPSTGVRQGGTIKIAVVSDPVPYPFNIPGGINSLMVSATIFNSLLKYAPADLAPAPDLASKWEADPSGKIWTFQLRSGVKWHDGEPFTSGDVKFTYEAILASGSNAFAKSNFTTLQTIDAPDGTTAKMTFSGPIASVPVLVGYSAQVLPAHSLKGQDMNNPAAFIKKPVGTGPFKFSEWASGDHLTVVANKDYFEGAPHLDSILFKVVPDVNNQVAQMQTGELDFALPQSINIPTLKDLKNVEIRKGSQLMYTYLCGLNTNPLFQDKRVRQALAYALDRQTILDQLVSGYGILATGPLNPALKWAYDDQLKPYPFDPDKAKQLLQEAGWTPGSDGILQKDGKRFSVSLMVDNTEATRQQIATTAQQQYKSIGIEVKIDVQEYNVFIQKVRGSQFEMVTFYFVLPADPDLSGYYSTTASRNYWKYSNPQVDDLLQQGRAELDQQKRKQIYDKVSQMIYDDQPVVYLYYPYEIQAVNKRLQGLPLLAMNDKLMLFAKDFWVTQ